MTGVEVVLMAVLVVWSSFSHKGMARDPPRVSSIYQRRHFVHPGAAIKLVCPLEPGSNPPPLVAWQREGESIHPGWDRYKVQEEGRVLRIIGVEWEDGGTFVCRVTNGFGSVDVTHLLYVHDGNRTQPKPPENDESYAETNQPEDFGRRKTQVEIVPPFPGNVTVSPGDEAVFTCHAQGDGEPRIQWLKLVDVGAETGSSDLSRSNHTVISFNHQRYMIVEGSLTMPLRDGTYFNKLSLYNVRERDSGLYICSTMNGRGFGFRSAYLHVVPGSRQSPIDRSQGDPSSVSDANLIPIVIAVVGILGAVLFLIMVGVFCRRHYRRKTPSFELPPKLPAINAALGPRRAPTAHARYPQDQHVSSPSLPHLSAHPARVVHPYGGPVPHAPIRGDVHHPEMRFMTPYYEEVDTTSECSTLFKPTPAPAGTPIPTSEVDYLFHGGLHQESYPVRQYYDEC